MSTRSSIGLAAVAVFAGTVAAATQAYAWSEDLWSSGYNILVRVPETITGGSADVWVQNNTGAALPNFTLVVDGGTATRKTMTKGGHDYLLPGENSHFTITTSATKGASLKLSVQFGWHHEASDFYGTVGVPVVIQDSKCTITPSTDPAVDFAKGKAITNSLRYAAAVDFGPDVVAAMGKLLDAFCAGRATWTTGGTEPTVKDCRNQAYDTCPAAASGTATQLQFDAMYETVQIASRKAAILPELLPKLRSRLICAAKDPDNTFAAMAMVALGYLGEDAKARAFLESMAPDHSRGVIAKAALLLLGSADDMTKYGPAVKASAGTGVEGLVCNAAFAIAAKDDKAAAVLIEGTEWTDPDTKPNASAACNLLLLAAWNQKKWGPKATEGVAVSFYKDDQTAWPCTVPFAGVTGGGGGGVDGGTTATDGGATQDGPGGGGTPTGQGGTAGTAGSAGSSGVTPTGTGGQGATSSSTTGAGGSGPSTTTTPGATSAPSSGGGCGCSLPGNRAWPLSGLLVLALLALRRRSRASAK